MEMEDYGAVLADTFGGKPSNAPRVKYGTVTKVSGSTLDVSLAGGTITGVCMTVSCAGAKVGDRVVLLVDGALVTCLGIVATADNARYVKQGDDLYSISTNFVEVFDTRNDNHPPSWYMKNRDRRVTFEFKGQAVLGIDSYGFCTVMTVTPWYDISGGAVKQIALCDMNIFFRTGKNDSEWNDWQRMNNA